MNGFFLFKRLLCLAFITLFIGILELSGMEPQSVNDDKRKSVSCEDFDEIMPADFQGSWKDWLAAKLKIGCHFVAQTAVSTGSALVSKPLIPQVFFEGPFNQDCAQTYVDAHDYACLDFYLRHYIGNKDFMVAAWIKQTAQLGIVPCCYLDVRNRMLSFQVGMCLDESEVKALARDVIILLVLIQLDIATWYVLIGEMQEGQLDKVAYIYTMFKQKILSKLSNFEGFKLLPLAQILEQAQTSINTGQPLINRLCAWVLYCSWSRSVTSYGRIMYEVIQPSYVSACMSKQKNALETQKRLLKHIFSTLYNQNKAQFSFDQFLKLPQSDFDVSWYRELRMDMNV